MQDKNPFPKPEVKVPLTPQESRFAEMRKDTDWQNKIQNEGDEFLGKDVIRLNVIIALLGVLCVLIVLMFVPFVLSSPGLALGSMVGGGMMLGLMLGAFIFDKPLQVWFLNTLMKSRNYHLVFINISGKRLVDYVVQVRNDPVKEIKGKSFIMNPNMIYRYKRVPTLFLNEKDIDPVSLDYDVARNRDPQLVTDYIMARINKEKFKAQKLGKQQQLIMIIILILAGAAVGVGILNYLKVDGLQKGLEALFGGAKK